jgi:hypothetical protein
MCDFAQIWAFFYYVFLVFTFYFLSFYIVPPDIEPFGFGDLSIRTLSGTRTRVICGLTRGDLPVTFHWLKDGIPLHHHYSLLLRTNTHDSEPVEPIISSVDLFSSLLTINQLTQGEISLDTVTTVLYYCYFM